ncbi:MAG: squalene synthase HpnC [Elusimicrobiota bacterium]
MNTLKAYEAGPWDPKDILGAYRFCSDLAKSHYENFPVASLFIPWRLRRHVAALYAFARVADDFADEPEYEGARLERLAEWREKLDAAIREPATHPVFIALADTIRTLDLPLAPFTDLLSAFSQDVEKKSYADWSELLDYCRRSANPVGRVVLMIHGLRDEELFKMSDDLCTALQLANFWQDVSIDIKKDRIYIPREDFSACGYSEADLRMGVVNERFRSLMKIEVARARELFEQSRELPRRLPKPLAWEIRLTWLGGRQILRKIRDAGYDALSRRPHLSRWDWIPLIARLAIRS